MGVRFLTREIGSLAKPSWRVKAFAGRPVEDADLAEAERWGRRLGVGEHERLIELLRIGTFGEAERAEIDDWAVGYSLALLQRAGLDVVYDGEQRRTEMYDHVAAHARGFEARGIVRAFDNKYYSKAAVVERPSLEAPYDVEEFRFVTENTNREVKVPLTGAYTMVDWSYDEHYRRQGVLGASASDRYAAREEFVRDVAERVVRPNAIGLVEAGADWIQLDEPAAATKPDEAALVVLGFNTSLRGVEARKKSMHICFSDYSSLWPAVLDLDDCLELQLEFANRDSRELGTRKRDRPGYQPLDLFRQPGSPGVGLGVLDIHSDFAEPPELVRDRILYAVQVLGDPARIQVNPDCGLRTRSWDVAYEKLTSMVEGTRLAEEALGGSAA